MYEITYSQSNDIIRSHTANQLLAVQALVSIKANDASFVEKVAAQGTSTAMKVKSILGMRLKKGENE